MYSKKTLESANSFAVEYEKYVLNREWCGPKILFDELKSLINCGDKLLDLGIGTGLASKPFKNAGLHITGIDGSQAMLEICKKYKTADKLYCIDLALDNIDLMHDKFNVVISHAVFHMIKSLEPIFKTIAQHLVQNGIFAFTVIPYNSTEDKDFIKTSVDGIYERTNIDSGLLNFRHSVEYILKISRENSFTITVVRDKF